ncbi:MAG TPA: phosphoribosylanthranilate isomerase [Desulfobacteraceae bacterium]|nr:phosphoribosylanthranilate isomerase [Desulfobacteraceae bacterium]HPJ68502.1 phosphoribosylanthranilate isomerase [Desulfobacteraceae bacterium]HPQ27260.1 phosphoribosylanthranilate isomerase [Desulfobacteraceae bacterium]
MTGVKICGITNAEDALAAVRCGADAVGFIFYRKSPRYISPEDAKEIIDLLPESTAKVGVFVNYEISGVKRIMELCRLDLVQLHGNESPVYCSSFDSRQIIKAIAREPGDSPELEQYPVKALLIDAYDPKRHGGTGKTSDWELAARISKVRPLILSGGLNAENIRDAIRAVSPDAVDINSGVEISPGRKDHRKIHEIVEIVRASEKHIQKEGSIFSRQLN